jgi:hypothetical protein
MPETITLQALDLSGETLTMFLRKSDGSLLNTGGDGMTESGSTGVFTATLAESRSGLGPLNVRICAGSETADNLLYDGFLAEGTTVIDSVMRAELDSASRLAIWNTLTTETFTADSFGELLLISDGTNGRAVKVTGANHIAADVHDCQADGLSGSTEIANIQDAAGWLLAIGSGAVANPQTSTEQYDITQFGVNYRVAMAGLTSTGTRTAPTLSKP